MRLSANISRPSNSHPVPPPVVQIHTTAHATTDSNTKTDTANTELGKLVEQHSALLSSLPWVDFVHRVRGRSCIAPLVSRVPHRAATILDEFRRAGVPVLCTDPEWSPSIRHMATTRGCHKSACESRSFVHSDMADMVSRGYWVVLPYHLVKTLPNLRISPIGCVLQRERRPRIIVDYTYSGINAVTDRQAHQEAMQFGGTLKRILRQIMSANPKHGHTYMLKIDLSDGFYRVPVRPADVPRLGVILPPLPGSNNDLIAFPVTLPMGWTESPPQFTAFTETVTDLTNRLVAETSWDPPAHPLERLASSEPPLDPSRTTICLPAPTNIPAAPPPTASPDILVSLPNLPAEPTSKFVRYQHKKPLAYCDVYLDDEIMLGQGSQARLNRLRRTLLHCNDMVFRPNDDTDNSQGRREPISTKKLMRGDACWSTSKIILGWKNDTI